MPSEFVPSFDRYMVPTNELADIVIPVLNAMSARHERSNTHHNEDAGPHAEILFRLSKYLGIEENSVPRRVYSIRVRETFTTGLDLADSFLLCIGKRLDEVDLPVFPANLETAREMVKSRFPRMPKKERNKLATSLHRFGHGYVEEAADDETLERVRDANKKRRARLIRSNRELDEARATSPAELYAEMAA